MGYVCPVCGDPQSDAGHLANHLAFTAMLRGGDHEDWLDEHAPDWAGMDEAALAETVGPLAEETDFPQVFEDTTDHGHSHDHGSERTGPSFTDPSTLPGTAPDGDLDEEARQALAEAREMTRTRRANQADDGEGEDGTGAGAQTE